MEKHSLYPFLLQVPIFFIQILVIIMVYLQITSLFLTLKSLLTYSSHFHFPSFFSSHSLTSILLFLVICYSLSLNDGIIYRYICSNKALSVLTFLYVTLGICVCILFNYISFLLPFMSFSYIFTCILKRIFYISILICSHN